MRNLVVESLNEDFRPQVNLKDEMTYYTDMEDSLTDEGNEDLKDDFAFYMIEFLNKAQISFSGVCIKIKRSFLVVDVS